MSVPVDIADLGAQLERFGSAPFLITTGDDQRPHTTHVVVRLGDGTLQCSVGRRTAANVVARPLVCLLWPPCEPGGYSLIVDGRAESIPGASPSVDSPAVRVEPMKAVLHRNALGDGYEADCLRIDGSRP